MRFHETLGAHLVGGVLEVPFQRAVQRVGVDTTGNVNGFGEFLDGLRGDLVRTERLKVMIG